MHRLKSHWYLNLHFRLASMTIIGFCLWGGWAMYANFNHGMPVALMSGAAQGFQSAISTFFGSAFIEWLYEKCKNWKYSILIVGGVGSIGSFMFMLMGHIVVGTPELLLTLMPVVVMATVYCFGYTYSLTNSASISKFNH